MQFPSHLLKPKGGEIYAHIFENSRTGLSRGLFWSFSIEFEPLLYDEDEFDCSMTCEWLRWPIRNWHDLEGKRLEAAYGDNGIEASFYMSSHYVAKSVRLQVLNRSAATFRVLLAMTVDFHGYVGDDRNPEMPVAAEFDIPFTGLIIVPENLFPKPSTVEEAKEVARGFVDIDRYERPERDRHRYVLRPRIETEV